MKLNHHGNARRFQPLLVATLSVVLPPPGAESASADYSLRGGQFTSGTSTGTSADYAQRVAFEPLAIGDAASDNYATTQGGQGPLFEIGGNLVANGSFEVTGDSFVPDINQIMSLPAGSTAIPGWTTLNAESIWASNASPFPPRTIHGNYSIDLTGYHDFPPFAGIQQTIDTVAGQTYRLTLALGTYEDDNRYQGPVTVRVTIAGGSKDITFTPDGPGNQWQSLSHDFTAMEAASTLQIIGLSATGGALLLLDHISIVATVPPLEFARFERLGSDLHFTWRTRPGLNYKLERRLELEKGSWQEVIGSEQLGDGAPAQFTLPDGLRGERSFFRLARPD